MNGGLDLGGGGGWGGGGGGVRLHISSSWVKIGLHTKNQLPRLGGGGQVTPSFLSYFF